jgi:DNA-binding response OmpR family regulator/HPt (histidine-containing phosphotransfer) domain-containing protein
MPPAEGPRDDEARLSGARAEFVASLPRRLEVLRSALKNAEQEPADAERINGLLRRVHATGSAARVLGFASVAEALAEAERNVRKSRAERRPTPFADVTRALDLLPSLVLGAPVSAPAAASRDSSDSGAFPISVLVLGPPSLERALSAGAGRIPLESERSEDAERVLELGRMIGPDIAVIDGDHAGSRGLITAMLSDPLLEPVPVVVVGSFDHGEGAQGFLDIGAARVLSKPCSPDTLRQTVEELREKAARSRGAPEPLGELTVQALAERIAGEFKRGLVDALESGSADSSVSLGQGHDVLAAVWGAVARVRELVTLRSSGRLRFEQSGPEGAVPVVPWGPSERRAGDRGVRAARGGSGVSLQGRRAVVADDDPAVVWFMSGLLRAVGVEVLEAHDGKRALEKTLEAWPDVVVSDVLMPKLDGFSLCHEIKRDVVVRDTPVILLSWKEDLLQRVRELGAGADGYLRKEAAASAVVERVREVLRTRARVEERIQSGGEVRGRLDGIMPRLVLALVGKEERDVRVSIRDAAFLFEAMVRRGQLVSVTRSGNDGSFARGASVLPSLLGVTAGRFIVHPDDSACRTELQGTMAALLEEPVKNARKSLGAVAASSLVRLSRLELDRPLVEAYLPSTPQPAATLMRRLLAGERAKDLVLEGVAASSVLEIVLSDIARRGGVLAAELDAVSIPVAEPSEPPPARWEPPAAATPAEQPAEMSRAAHAAGETTPEPRNASPEPGLESVGFAKTLESSVLSVSGPGGDLPLSQSLTPSVDTFSVDVSSTTLNETLEGMGELSRVTARDPRPPESSSPELVAEEADDDVLGLFAEAEASSAPKQTSSTAATLRGESPGGDAPAAVTPSPPSPSPSPANSPRGKASSPPFAPSAAKTMVSYSAERLPKSSRDQPTQPPTSRIDKKTGRRAPVVKAEDSVLSGLGILMLKGLVAFAVAFGFTTFVLIPVLSPVPKAPATEPPEPLPQPSASTSSATTPAEPGADAER